jgi:hypothetical protein
MSSPVYTSIIETTKLELAGAEQRLGLAKLAYKSFIDEHGILTDEGQVIYTPTPTREMFISFEHQRDALETEIDESLRRVAHCNEVIADLQLCAAVETDTVADLILGLPQVDEGEHDE